MKYIGQRIRWPVEEFDGNRSGIVTTNWVTSYGDRAICVNVISVPVMNGVVDFSKTVARASTLRVLRTYPTRLQACVTLFRHTSTHRVQSCERKAILSPIDLARLHRAYASDGSGAKKPHISRKKRFYEFIDYAVKTFITQYNVTKFAIGQCLKSVRNVSAYGKNICKKNY